MCVTIFSTGRKFRPVSIFTLVARSYALLMVLQMSIEYIPIFLSDIDECLTGANNCSDNATCTDTNGGYNCTCKRGFEGDGLTCFGECFLFQFVAL